MGTMKKKSDIPSWAKTGHRKPVTRREFLAHGIIPFAAYAMAPNFLGLLLGNRAHAQALVCPSSESSAIPFISFNLAGGAAMAANFLPMNAAGGPLASYNKMGLGNNQVPVEREFGNAPFAGLVNGVLLSKVLEGIRASAQASTLAKTAFLGVCTRSRDDSSENMFDISGLVTKFGTVGNKLPNMGVRSTNTGAGQRPAVVNPPPPLIVRGFRDLQNSLGYSAALGTQLSTTQKEKLANLVSNLNSEQTRKLASMSSGSQVQTLVECAGVKNVELAKEGSALIDPRANTQVATVWGLNANTQQNAESMVFGSMVYNALLGQGGTVTLEKGNYDYHDGSRNTGNNRDRDAGVIIGRILESAAALNKPVFLYVTSDGAVSSPDSDDRQAPWTSDRGSAGAAYILMYHPTARPQTTGFQIGQFTDGQAADDKFIIGNDPALAAQAVFANYLKFNGKLDQFNRFIPRGALEAAAIAQVVKVA